MLFITEAFQSLPKVCVKLLWRTILSLVFRIEDDLELIFFLCLDEISKVRLSKPFDELLRELSLLLFLLLW